jgi:hypothetical protein
MRLIGGMTIDELLDKSRSMGELSSQNYDRWVKQVLESDRDELNQWNVLNHHSGCVELPLPAQKEMFVLEKSKDYQGLTEWLLVLQYPVFWDSAAFWLKRTETLLDLLPFVVKANAEDKTKRFLLWTLVHVWQVRCRNMVMGKENRKPGWGNAHRNEIERGIDRIISVMGREDFERLYFRFDCFWANERLESFYIIVCEYLAATFRPKYYIQGFGNMNYLNHIARRCGSHFLKDKLLAAKLIESIKDAAGRMSNSWPSTWETVASLIYTSVLPIYIYAHGDIDAAIERDLNEVLVTREGWKVEKEWGILAEKSTREAIWFGMLVWVVTELDREDLFHKIVNQVFAQYRLFDKHPQRGTFELMGLLMSVYKRTDDKRKTWIDYLDKKVLEEINDFVYVAVLISGRENYAPDVKKAIQDRWELEKDVLEVKLKGKDLWTQIQRWMRYGVR